MAERFLGAGLVSILALGATLASPAWADISISNKATANMSCGSGVCTATAAKAVLNVGELQTMLASGDVAVKTGSLAKDIDIDQPLTWVSTSRLTLDAQQSVTTKKQVTVSGTSNLTIVTTTAARKARVRSASSSSCRTLGACSSRIWPAA